MGAGFNALLVSEGYIRPQIADSAKLPAEMEISETEGGAPGQNSPFSDRVPRLENDRRVPLLDR
jgi:hypothetical protein